MQLRTSRQTPLGNGRWVERLVIVTLAVWIMTLYNRIHELEARSVATPSLSEPQQQQLQPPPSILPPKPLETSVITKRGSHDWYNVAKTTSTDKITKHCYDVAYDKYLPPLLEKGKIKLLEIGLGCNMKYGPGASLKVWLEYFKDVQLELHFMEYDRACAERWQPKYPNIKFHIGDQGNVTHLQRVIDDSGGQFDVIIDDGGHSMKQQIVTMEHMIPNALKEGGLFFMEDLTTSYEGDLGSFNAEKYYDYGENRTTNLICDIVGDMHKAWYYRSKTLPRKHWLYKYILNVDCFRGLCVMQKLPPAGEMSASMRYKGAGRS